MKFAKELEHDLVPEWRVKYLDYKAGKKKVKAVARAVQRANSTPRTPSRPSLNPQHMSLYGATSPLVARNIPRTFHDGAIFESGESNGKAPMQKDAQVSDANTKSIPIAQNHNATEEYDGEPHYGSFVPTPPAVDRHSFELPDPAIAPESPLGSPSANNTPMVSRKSSFTGKLRRGHSIANPQNAYEVGPTTTPTHRTTFASLRSAKPQAPNEQPLLRRMFSAGTPLSKSQSRPDVDMVAIDQVKLRQQEFFSWMDKELEKVNNFYKSKEDEAGVRLQVLREQLHEMRNRRIQEVVDVQRARSVRKDDLRPGLGKRSRGPSRDPSMERPTSKENRQAWLAPIERLVGQAKATAFGPRPGSNSKALQSMTASPATQVKSQTNGDCPPNDNRDYVRRPRENEVSYRSAKRKLKAALQEYYRGMELLKSYALLNRTAFRKINKKYDKAVNAQPPLRFMAEKVNKAWFVESDILDGHIHAVEDLYARYFERGNHKIAVGKLRKTTGKPADQSGGAFQNGLMIGIGAVFSIQGVTYGVSELLNDPDPTIRFQTGYLLQIYGGYFLALYLFSWFCLDCSIWSRHKINYKFVFEFDPRHDLDWRELTQFPSFLILLLGLFMWVNFTRYGSPEMFIYYPIILIFVTIVIIFLPAPIFFYRSRKWFVYSHWRLILAGLYPVEFRDFFLGDMYCSLTYFMSNIELFFCLYATYWHNPTTCNSSNSRLLGFFSALPSVWRALQCLRRYYDTRNAFPHLVNCGKYGFTILYQVMLSVYRIDTIHINLIVFSTFAALSAVYSTTWDLFMDWSLLQSGAKKPLLRDVRGFKTTWWYYAAIAIDPILRFNWIFYSIYTSDLQHNTPVSFFVNFSEVTRRGIWTLFRVENEHCSNVVHFKASRDVPLPYDLESGMEESRPASPVVDETSPVLTNRTYTSTALSQHPSHTDSIRRRPARTFTKVLADAHMQDFEKKRKPKDSLLDGSPDVKSDDDDMDDQASSDDEQDAQDVLDVENLVRNQTTGNGEGSRGRSHAE